MLEHFRYIQNLGRYRQVRGTEATRLRSLTLIFSENGRGKTTLCAILRALVQGSPTPLLERKRLDNTDPTRVVIDVDGATASFDGSAWSGVRGPGPQIHIFDEHFVDENVYSGLSVEPSHRQGVHALILGTEGVKYQKRVEELSESIEAIQAVIRERENAIPSESRYGLSVEDFCRLEDVQGIDSKIAEAEQTVAVLRDTDPIRQAPHFQAFALPQVSLEETEALLARSLPDLDQNALDAVLAHVSSLGSDAERWISDGETLRSGSSSCPFCGQSVSTSALVAHYRAYFSDAYREHKHRISAALADVQRSLGGDNLAAFERKLQIARDNARFWTPFVGVPQVQLDSEAIAASWTTLRSTLIELFEAKSRAPLERISVSEAARDAFADFQSQAERVRTTSNNLLETRGDIDRAKEQASHGNLDLARRNLARLKAIKSRFTPEVNHLCSDVETEKARKAVAERQREEARQALAEQRERVFNTYQTSLNDLLVRLNADFSIEELRPSDRGRKGAPSTSYALRVNKARVDLAAPEQPGPSFKTALSAGDRNTLALAFFFAMLEQQDLTHSIVVIDDPASSLDSGRSLKTVQQVRRLIGRAHQVIVMSHSEDLLCRLWKQANRDGTATLQIKPAGEEQSDIQPWDADAASVTEHDRLFALVKAYGMSATGDPQEVAPSLRVLLESFLRVAFPDFFRPGEQLGHFITRCKTELDRGSPVLNRERTTELDELVEYANLFHHSTNQFGWREALGSISESELQAHARDAIALVEKLRGSR